MPRFQGDADFAFGLEPADSGAMPCPGIDDYERPFALVGFVAFVLMIPLAATSFNRAIKALGAARWQALHRCVYAIALLGLLHFFWMRAGKNDFAEWSIYALVLSVLLGWRLLKALQRREGQRMKPGSQSASGWNLSTVARATTRAATNSQTPR